MIGEDLGKKYHMIGEDLNKYHKITKFKDGRPFYNFKVTGSHTDYSSSGEAHTKWIASAGEMFGIPDYFPRHVVINAVLDNPQPFLNKTHETNMNSFNNGYSLHTTSSHKPTIDSFNTRRHEIHKNGYITFRN